MCWKERDAKESKDTWVSKLLNKAMNNVMMQCVKEERHDKDEDTILRINLLSTK